jgi:hypothetical protein
MSFDNLGLTPKIIGAFAGALLSILFVEPKNRRDGWRRFVGSFIAGPIIATFVLHQTAWPPTWDFVALAALLSAFLAFPVLKTGYRLAQAWVERKME